MARTKKNHRGNGNRTERPTRRSNRSNEGFKKKPEEDPGAGQGQCAQNRANHTRERKNNIFRGAAAARKKRKGKKKGQMNGSPNKGSTAVRVLAKSKSKGRGLKENDEATLSMG